VDQFRGDPDRHPVRIPEAFRESPRHRRGVVDGVLLFRVDAVRSRHRSEGLVPPVDGGLDGEHHLRDGRHRFLQPDDEAFMI